MPNLKLEQFHVDQFVRLYLDIKAVAKSQEPPEPDFTVDFFGKTIGIEHTQLIKLPDENGIDFKAHTRIAQRIMQKAETTYNQNQSLCLLVHVHFRCDYKSIHKNPIQLYNNDIDKLSKFISGFISFQIPFIESSSHGSSFRYETMIMVLEDKFCQTKLIRSIS